MAHNVTTMAARADKLETGSAPKRIGSGAEYIESLRGRGLKVYLFGELVAEPVDHPVIRPSINAVAETYDLAARNPELATAVSPYTGEPVNRFLHIVRLARGSRDAEQDAAAARPAHRHLLPALRRHGCAERAALRHFRDRRQACHALSPALPGIPDAGPAAEPRDRRRHDRRERRPRQGAPRAGRSGPLRPRHAARRQGPIHPWREGAPDRLHQLALAGRDADDAPRPGRQGLRRHWRAAGRRPRHHLHLRPAVLRYPRDGGRHRRRQPQVSPARRR